MKKGTIDISTGCLIFLCAYGFFDPYESFLPFLISVALHEGGHLLAILILKEKVYRFKGELGNFTLYTAPLSYSRELMVASMGPAVNLLLFFAIPSPMFRLINGILLCYNMLPFYPLDGGRILRSTLRSLLPLWISDKAEKAVGFLTYGCMIMGSIYLTLRLHSGLWPIMFCIFILYRVTIGTEEKVFI